MAGVQFPRGPESFLFITSRVNVRKSDSCYQRLSLETRRLEDEADLSPAIKYLEFTEFYTHDTI
jgi:hypothetical protein